MKPKKGAYLSPSLSVQEHVNAALNFDIGEMWNNEAPGLMHEVNPNFICLRYRNCQSVILGSDEFQYFVDNNLILKDEYGNYCRHIVWPENHLAFVGSPLYREFIKNWILNKLSTTDYDGIFGDLLGRPWVPPFWEFNPPPIDPRTEVEYTNEAWAKDQLDLINYIQGNYILLGNGIPQANSAWGYYAKKNWADPIINSLDAIMIEGPWGWDSDEVYLRTVNDWIQNVQLLEQLSQNNKVKWYFNHNLGGGDKSGLFVYCSFMMVEIKPNIYYTYYNKNYMEQSFWQSLMKIDPGKPLGSVTQIEGTEIFKRVYENNEFYVNPSPQNSYQINGVTMMPLSGMIRAKTGLTIDAPSSVEENTGFTVSGTLIRSDTLESIRDATITLSYNGNILGEAITDANGNYQKQVKIPESGNYILQSYFSGIPELIESVAQKGIKIGEIETFMNVIYPTLIGATILYMIKK